MRIHNQGRRGLEQSATAGRRCGSVVRGLRRHERRPASTSVRAWDGGRQSSWNTCHRNVLALTTGRGDPLQLLRRGGQVVDLADEPGQVGPVVVAPRLVGARHLGVLDVDQGLEERRHRPPAQVPGDAARARAVDALDGGPPGSEPGGGGRQQVGAEPGDAVVVVAEHDVRRERAPLLRDGEELVDVVDHGDAVPVDVEAVRAGDLVHPLAAVRRADPQGPVDAQRLQTQGAPVQEDVLAGVRTEALAEEDDPRAAALAVRLQPLEDAQPQQPVLLAGLPHPPERQRRGPPRVLHRHRRHVATGQVLGRRERDVVDVAQAGRRDQHEEGAVEGAGALHLGEREVDPLPHGGGAVEPDVDLHRCREGRLAHHRLDGQVRESPPAGPAPGPAARG